MNKKNNGQAIQVLRTLQVLHVYVANMASNAGREIDEVREERLSRRDCDKLRKERETSHIVIT